MKNNFLFIFCIFTISCSNDKAKENLNKAGDITGQVVGEFVTGVSNGVEKAMEVKIELTDELKNKGIQFGKMSVTNGKEGKDNLLIVYMIFNSDIKCSLTAKSFDNKGIEMGRSKVEIEGKKDEAKYIEFAFDKRTDIDNDSKITIE